MYTLTRAYFRQDRRKGRWESFDAGDVPILSLSSNYGDVWLFVTYPAASEEKAVHIGELINLLTTVTDTTLTVNDWLTQIGNRTLPFADELPTFEPHYVRYRQAWQAGYQIDPIGHKGTVEQGGSVFAKADLKVTHPDLNPRDIRRRALFSVNGFFHLTDVDDDGLYIIDGNKTVRQANDNAIGVHSFSDIGDLTLVPITDDMVFGETEDSALVNAAYLKMADDIDLDNKTVLLVVGGYLQVLGKGYTRVNERVWRVELNYLSLMERYFDSVKTLDLSSLNLTHYDKNPDMVSVSELHRNETIRAYLTLSQSFMVVVDAPSFFEEQEPIEYARLPDRYLMKTFDYPPLLGTCGKVLEYTVVKERHYYVLATCQNRRQRFDFHGRPWLDQLAVDNSRYPDRPTEQGIAFIRRLGIEK